MSDQLSSQHRLIGWGITQRCNLACPHCYSSAKRHATDELTTDEARGVIDALVPQHVAGIGWTGGEPLLRKDLEELIAYAAEVGGMRSGITTNGVLLTHRRVKALREVGVSSVQVSLDGSTAARNARMRGATAGQFAAILDGIGFCLESGMRVDLAMLLGRENLRDAEPFVRLAESLGVVSVRFCAFVPWGDGKADAVRERLEFTDGLAELAETVLALRTHEGMPVMFDPAFGPLPPDYRFHTCIAGRGTFYISHNGDVYPCTALLDNRFKVGNLRERSLDELLDDPDMTAMADFDRSAIQGACEHCDHRDGCRGACRGIAHAYTGDLTASPPNCLAFANSIVNV
jgi:radical SAM protein with 4Fe4S-binding SPASM domain